MEKMENKGKPLISIIVLTYNAPSYVRKTLRTLAKTSYPNYEVIVFDNNSRFWTRQVLLASQKRGWAKRVILSDENLLFAAGNNEAFKAISSDAKYVLLLNSDVKIVDPKWLDKLFSIHERGVSTLGFCASAPARGDGYCFLIDRDLYGKYLLDTEFQWWWGITKLQSLILRDGLKVKAVKEHEELLHHYGGASGDAWKKAKGMDVDIEDVKRWFEKNEVEIIEKLR